MQGLPLRTPGVQVISSLLVVTIPASSMTLKLQPWRLVAPSPFCRSSKAASPPAPSGRDGDPTKGTCSSS